MLNVECGGIHFASFIQHSTLNIQHSSSPGRELACPISHSCRRLRSRSGYQPRRDPLCVFHSTFNIQHSTFLVPRAGVRVADKPFVPTPLDQEVGISPVPTTERAADESAPQQTPKAPLGAGATLLLV